MKRPLIDEYDRRVLREMPDTLYGQHLKLFLAKKHLARELSKTAINILNKTKKK